MSRQGQRDGENTSEGSNVLEFSHMRGHMRLQTSSRFLDIRNGGVDWAQMLILDLDHLASRQYGRERVFAYRRQL
jgi:hypothetical protein